MSVTHALRGLVARGPAHEEDLEREQDARAPEGTGSLKTVHFQDVSFAYGRRRVLENIELTVQPGITALMGPNGTGKTTLLNLAAGALRPSSGQVITSSATRTESGGEVFLLPQRFEFVPSMRLEEVVALASWCSGVHSVVVPTNVVSALEAVGLSERARERVRALSGGQRQRLGLACALSARPAVLLLDEPSVGLDPVQRATLRVLLKDLSRSVTIVISSHLVDDIAGVADRVVILLEGRLSFDGPLPELTNGDPSIAGLERAYVDLVTAGART